MTRQEDLVKKIPLTLITIESLFEEVKKYYGNINDTDIDAAIVNILERYFDPEFLEK